jgi:hypothetical protein
VRNRDKIGIARSLMVFMAIWSTAIGAFLIYETVSNKYGLLTLGGPLILVVLGLLIIWRANVGWKRPSDLLRRGDVIIWKPGRSFPDDRPQL